MRKRMGIRIVRGGAPKDGEENESKDNEEEKR